MYNLAVQRTFCQMLFTAIILCVYETFFLGTVHVLEIV